MIIEELKASGEVEGVEGGQKDRSFSTVGIGNKEEEEENIGAVVVSWDAKRVLVGASARALFYPTLLYNVVRNKIEPEFRWWDRVHEFLLLGAVPFPSDVPLLKELGVGGVVTLNEPYETLVPSSLYHVGAFSLLSVRMNNVV
ncbi:hypothetical protein Tsubulata_023511 [Turnera subulata]|uniref:Uncharacterized protein n=1 Tax=Turnera subulata TaxID=218843 RepID=A0A9Q0JMX0_9ROSI|nr:hypothetical protein Tsubulata_023511 [Turnera subulata]